MTKLMCVPVEPTDGMVVNAWSAVWTQSPSESDDDAERNEHRAKYEAMLAAAPPPPADIEYALRLAHTNQNLGIASLSDRALLKSWGMD